MSRKEKTKKRKSHILSVVGILCGCLVVFAGYWTMQQMLEKRQTKLLSQGGSLMTAAEDAADAGENEDGREKLTEEELSDILFRNYVAMGKIPHEPYGKQMTMQEAIETGQKWISAFGRSYGFPDADGDSLQFEEVAAQLCTAEMPNEEEMYGITSSGTDRKMETDGDETAESDRGTRLQESMYGYWRVAFYSTGVSVTLKINAVSGQVLRMYMETDSEYEAIEKLPLGKILNDYVESFALEGINSQGEWSGDIRYRQFEYKEEIVFCATSETDISQNDEYGISTFLLDLEPVLE